MYHLKYRVTKMNDDMYHIAKVSIQPIYHDMIQSTSMYICMYVCIYVYMYVCMYVCIIHLEIFNTLYFVIYNKPEIV